jgi:hypothetical protein
MEIKRSPYLYALWALVLGGLGFLVFTHRVDWSTAGAFVVALGLPSLLGKSEEKKP